MALLLAPYNNGMRLGQGFNSYTQQICIDDAVVIDPDRVDNPVTNDGFTMRELRYAIGARAGDDDDDDDDDYDEPSPLPLPLPSVTPGIAEGTGAVTTGVPAATTPSIGPAPPTALDTMTLQLNQDIKTVAKLVEDIANLEASIEDAINPTSEETKRDVLLLEKKRTRLARIKNSGTGAKPKSVRGTKRELSQRGPSQIVSYSSRFVNKISEVTDDMNISGSLSIKYGTIGGSGKGSFIDSDKFKESDMNFFISVKVINQSINIKDALVFQGLPSVNESNFRSVFGDSYISGFLEGGEFNAMVSMKVVNKAKIMSIKAEAEIAMSVGAADIKANANVNIDKSNFSSQTETTIQVGWSGGGHIKPMSQPWTIQTLMATAAKFPDLVASSPQRTYAILTKYESLRSFMALKPPALGPMFYENAAIYTNALLDAYMDYKNIYRNLGTDLSDIQAGTKVFKGWEDTVNKFADKTTLSAIDDELPFPATIKGIDLARRACRFQMVKIVVEVDEVAKDPSLAAKETRPEAFQSPIVFRERLPVVNNKAKLPNLKIFDTDEVFPGLLENPEDANIRPDEAAKAASYVDYQPDVGKYQRLAPMVGTSFGVLFCNLDFVKPDFSLRTVTVEIYKGVVSALALRYANGLTATIGTPGASRKVFLALRAEENEKIIACSIETATVAGDKSGTRRVTALRLYTNRGPDLEGNSKDWEQAKTGTATRDGVDFENIELTHFDPLIVNSHVKGFWGHAVTTATLNPQSGIYRLAPIWGNKEDKTESGAETPEAAPSAIVTAPEEQVVSCRGRLDWQGGVAGRFGTFEQTYLKPLPIVPIVLYGFRLIDIAQANSPRVALGLSSVNEWGYTISLKSFLHETWNLEANVLVLPNGRIPFQHGYVDASDNPGGRAATQNAIVRVTFAKPFDRPPKVAVWFTEIHQPHGHRSLWTHVSDITKKDMKVHIDTWNGRQFEGARVAWLAWPEDKDGDGGIIKAGTSEFKPGAPWSEAEFYGGPFQRVPSVFTALNWIDFPEGENTLHMTIRHDWATENKLKWCAWAADWTPMEKIGMCWIAVE